uniref:Uncharacterized protein n=1 Tax=Tetradesmus obliquus TaxID=3088 RepID=A0A383WFN6_TETOB|eukprot:jgi/Sobl393_1/9268/SZX75834.1
MLLAAVEAAHINSCSKPLQQLCRAWQPIGSCAVASMAAAAVQLGCLPVLQWLLRLPAAQQLLCRDVAALMRWAIHTNPAGSSSSSSSSSGTDVSLKDKVPWNPCPPSYIAARAEVLAAVCSLPAAQQISCSSLVGLLVRAMQHVEAVQQLCKLRAAAALDRHCISGLLRWARVLGSRPGRDAVVGALAGLRGAEGLKAADVGELLQLYGRIDGMMGWSAGHSVEEGVQPAEVSLARWACA